jgi:hypothetical protein
MSLYRQAAGVSRRTLAVIALGCLIAGGAAGFAIGRVSAPDPTLSELAADARTEVRPALSALELVTIEYPEAVQKGEVVAATEYDAAVAQAASAADVLAAAEQELAAIDPEGHAAASELVGEVVSLVEAQAPPQTVEAMAGDTTKAVEALVEPVPERP